mgnify:FL=1
MPLLINVAAERVLAELRYLCQTPQSSQWLAMMVADDLLAGWLEIPVREDFGERLTQIDRAIDLIRQHYPVLDRELQQPLRDTISISRGAMSKLTVLLSPELPLATAQMLRLTFSTIEIQVVKIAITYLPQLLRGEMSLSEQYFWFKSVGNNFPLLVILAIASGVKISDLESLIDRYLDPNDQVSHPTPLVNGHNLIQALQIAPSPTIGKLLTEIQLARIMGKIATPADAIQFAQQMIES